MEPNNNEEPKIIRLSPEEAKQVQMDGFPMYAVFADLFEREGPEKMSELLQERGVSGAIMLFMDELLDPTAIHRADQIPFTHRCILFGYFLKEILEKVSFEGEDIVKHYYERNTPLPSPSLEELDNLWGED